MTLADFGVIYFYSVYFCFGGEIFMGGGKFGKKKRGDFLVEVFKLFRHGEFTV